MSPETTAILRTIPRIRCRHKRQHVYLNCLQSLSRGEAIFFFRIYNHVALTRSLTSQIYDWLAEEDKRSAGQPAVDLARHFCELFDIWLRSRTDGQDDLLNQVYAILEDLNIAAIACRQNICLGHARHRNACFKAQQQQFYLASGN